MFILLLKLFAILDNFRFIIYKCFLTIKFKNTGIYFAKIQTNKHHWMRIYGICLLIMEHSLKDFPNELHEKISLIQNIILLLIVIYNTAVERTIITSDYIMDTLYKKLYNDQIQYSLDKSEGYVYIYMDYEKILTLKIKNKNIENLEEFMQKNYEYIISSQ